MPRPLLPWMLLAGALVSGCGKSGAPATAAKAVPSSPVPPPDGLVADVVMRGPDALWGKLQQGMGGPLSHLPQSMAGALAGPLKLDVALASEVDGAAPAYAVVARPGATFAWAAAMKLRDLAHARDTLFGGKSPRFHARDADGELVVVEPGPGSPPRTAETITALSPLGYLVVARSEADLVTLAPYATRTLPSRPPSAHAAVVSMNRLALAGPIRDELTNEVATLRAGAAMLDTQLRQVHGGKAPDLGDPAAVMDALDDYARSKIAVLADLDHAEVDVDAQDDDVDVEVTLTPGMGTGPSVKAFTGMKTGDAAPLLTLSADTDVAILVEDDPAKLEESSKAAEDRAVAVFKPTLGPKDAKAIHEALTSWARGRGNWLAVGLELDGLSSALTVRTPTNDPDSAMLGVTSLLNLARLPAFKDLLEARFSVTGVSTATASAGGASTSIATFQRKGAKGGGELAVAWSATGDGEAGGPKLLTAAGALSSARALAATRSPAKLLGSDLSIAGKLGTLRDRAAVVLLGRKRDLDEKPSSVVIAIGRDKTNGWAMAEIDDSLLRDELARWLDR